MDFLRLGRFSAYFIPNAAKLPYQVYVPTKKVSHLRHYSLHQQKKRNVQKIMKWTGSVIPHTYHRTMVEHKNVLLNEDETRRDSLLTSHSIITVLVCVYESISLTLNLAVCVQASKCGQLYCVLNLIKILCR